MTPIKLNDNISIGEKPFLIAGPCIIESKNICMEIADFLNKQCLDAGVSYIFKASFDKANRSSIDSFRGIGFDEGLSILNEIKETFDVPVLTDIHECIQVEKTASAVDILQIPAFLCRQTDLLVKAGLSGKPVNIKKGQFMAPEDMQGAIDKVRGTGNNSIMLTERGTCFGYHNLTVDMRSLVIMRELEVPVIFDATHSVQLPGGLGNASGGQRQFVRPLARAAVAVGIDGLFMEVHPNPDQALSDGPNSLDFDTAATVIKEVKQLWDMR